MDEDYYLLTLMAVARELNAYGIREADVHLVAGLPLTWVRSLKVIPLLSADWAISREPISLQTSETAP